MKRLAIIVLFVLFFCNSVGAVTYYVNTASTGSGDGTTTATSGANAAWAAISEITGLSADDSVLFNKGNTWTERLVVPASGSSGSVITFGSYGTGADPIIDGEEARERCIQINSRSYITIENLKFTGCKNLGNGSAMIWMDSLSSAEVRNIIVDNCTFTTGGTDTAGVRMHSGSAYDIYEIEVTNCAFDNLDKAGVYLYYTGSYGTGVTGVIYNVTVDNNTFETISNMGFNVEYVVGAQRLEAMQNGRLSYGLTVTNNTGTGIYGIEMTCKETLPNLISSNLLYNCGDVANGSNTFSLRYCAGLTVEYNEVYGTTSTGSGDGAALMLDWVIAGDANYISDGVIVRYNEFHDNTDPNGYGRGIAVYRGKNCKIYNNLLYGNTRGMSITQYCTGNEIYNNVIYNNTSYGVMFEANAGSGNILKNNIINQSTSIAHCINFNDTDDIATQTFDNNCYYGPYAPGSDERITNGNFAAWTTDDPDNWTVVGESGNDPEISEAATGEAHVNTPTLGGGMCNLYTSDGTSIYIRQTTTLIVGRIYIFSIDVDTMTDPAIIVAGLPDGEVTYSSTGIKTITFVATVVSEILTIKRGSGWGAVDVTFDNVSIKLAEDDIVNVNVVGVFKLAEWQSTYSKDTNSIYADPLFVDAANANFHLSGASPCLGIGRYPWEFPLGRARYNRFAGQSPSARTRGRY